MLVYRFWMVELLISSLGLPYEFPHRQTSFFLSQTGPEPSMVQGGLPNLYPKTIKVFLFSPESIDSALPNLPTLQIS
jgi:hypothetical protein